MNILIHPLMMQLLLLLLFVTDIRSQLLQGHNCGIPTNSLRSTCRPIDDCHHSLSRITGSCGVENFRMLVCCEPREDIFPPHPQVFGVASMAPQIHKPQTHDGIPLLLSFNQPYEAVSYPQPFFSQLQHVEHPLPLAFQPQFPVQQHQSELAQISAGPRPLCQSQIPVEPQRLHQPHFPVNPPVPNQQPSTSTGLGPRKNSTSISQQKCKEYSKYVYEKDEDSSAENGENKEDLDTCGLFTAPLVVNGERAGAREFPHQALLFYQHARGDTMECTGSLISENFVMSAAHCSDIPVIGRPRYVIVGDLDYQTDDDDADPQRLKVIDIINHPSYRAGIQEYDITLLKLESNVIFNAYRRPACLNTNIGISETHAIASGWGATRFGGKTIRALQKVRLALTKDENECRIPYLRINPPINIDQEIMLCAGDVVGTNSTCQGDSGGPLQIKLQEPYCMHSVIGVTSFGVRCGMQIPAVFTRVSYFVPWIENIVWPKNSN